MDNHSPIRTMEDLHRELLVTKGRLAHSSYEVQMLKKELQQLKEYTCPRCDLSMESGFAVWGGPRQ